MFWMIVNGIEKYAFLSKGEKTILESKDLKVEINISGHPITLPLKAGLFL